MKNRRQFLGSLGAITAGVTIPSTFALEPIHRERPFFSGLSMTTYSLKDHMRWWVGKTGEGTMEMIDYLEYCAELGLEAAELTSYFFPEPLDQSYTFKVKRTAHLLGLDISGGAMGNSFAHYPGSDEAKAQMEYCKRWIDHFVDMGAPVIRVFAERGRPKGASDKQVIQNVIANLEDALVYAEKRGVILGLENHDLVKNIDYLMQILDAFDSEWLGVIWDSANFSPVPDPYVEMERIAPYAVTAQVKVMTKVMGKDVPTDYARMVQILKEANYRGYLVFEYEEEKDPFVAIPEHLGKLRRLI